MEARSPRRDFAVTLGLPASTVPCW